MFDIWPMTWSRSEPASPASLLPRSWHRLSQDWSGADSRIVPRRNLSRKLSADTEPSCKERSGRTVGVRRAVSPATIRWSPAARTKSIKERELQGACSSTRLPQSQIAPAFAVCDLARALVPLGNNPSLG
jgi:hypothetical protein